MLKTQHLRTFREVIRSGSYGAAARILGYSQPAISQQIHALEQSLETPLFTRHGRGIRLTDAGHALAKHAEIILSSLDVAAQQVTAIAQLTEGRVRLCAFPSANATIVPAAVAHLKSQAPGIRIELIEAEPPETFALLSKGECDISLTFSYSDDELPPDDMRVYKVRLLADDMVVALPATRRIPKGDSVSLTDLSDEAWITGSHGTREMFLDACARSGFVPDILLTTDDNLAMQSFVSAGLGIALMPSLALPLLPNPGVTTHPLRPRVRRSIDAYTLVEYMQIPTTVAMLDALRHATTSLRL